MRSTFISLNDVGVKIITIIYVCGHVVLGPERSISKHMCSSTFLSVSTLNYNVNRFASIVVQ